MILPLPERENHKKGYLLLWSDDPTAQISFRYLYIVTLKWHHADHMWLLLPASCLIQEVLFWHPLRVASTKLLTPTAWLTQQLINIFDSEWSSSDYNNVFCSLTAQNQHRTVVRLNASINYAAKYMKLRLKVYISLCYDFELELTIMWQNNLQMQLLKALWST